MKGGDDGWQSSNVVEDGTGEINQRQSTRNIGTVKVCSAFYKEATTILIRLQCFRLLFRFCYLIISSSKNNKANVLIVDPDFNRHYSPWPGFRSCHSRRPLITDPVAIKYYIVAAYKRSSSSEETVRPVYCAVNCLWITVQPHLLLRHFPECKRYANSIVVTAKLMFTPIQSASSSEDRFA